MKLALVFAHGNFVKAVQIQLLLERGELAARKIQRQDIAHKSCFVVNGKGLAVGKKGDNIFFARTTVASRAASAFFR